MRGYPTIIYRVRVRVPVCVIVPEYQCRVLCCTTEYMSQVGKKTARKRHHNYSIRTRIKNGIGHNFETLNCVTE